MDTNDENAPYAEYENRPCEQPSAAQLREVAQRMRRAADREGTLAMRSESISVLFNGEDMQCQTIACVAGHYLFESARELAGMELEACTDASVARYVQSIDEPWLRGAERLALDLGFSGVDAVFATEDGTPLPSASVRVAQLGHWASRHPERWGNGDGERLFCEAKAYGVGEGTDATMDDIATHWERIADTVDAIEREGLQR